MSDLIFQTYNDLNSAYATGRSLAALITHIRQILVLVPPKARSILVNRAHDWYKNANDSNCTLPQFIAYNQYFARMGELSPSERRDLGQRPPNPSKVIWDKLPKPKCVAIAAICDGKDVPGVTRVILNTFPHDECLNARIFDLLTSTLGDSVTSGALAAALSQCLAFNRRLVEEFQLESSELLAFSEAIPSEDFPSYNPEPESDWWGDPYSDTNYKPARGREHEILYDDVSFDERHYRGREASLKELLEEKSLESARLLNQEVRSKLHLEEKFGFVQSDSGLFVPTGYRAQLTSNLNSLIEIASEDKSHLMALSPRGFEEFMKELFLRLGYDVELTKCSRDGGVDIVCLKHISSGIDPIKLAVEVKRYREGRPIDVTLVRSFVGANLQYKADRLVYVTTSSYTSPARDYANKYGETLLALKDYGQIRDWCSEVTKQPWSLLPTSRNRR